MKRLAIITSHPVQYYAPWFRHIAAHLPVELRVFYLWDFGTGKYRDPGFQQEFSWDLPLLDGYDHEFVPNVSSDPGTHHFRGLVNPSLPDRVRVFNPDSVLMIGYNYSSMMAFLASSASRGLVRIFRGDSHRLAGGAEGMGSSLKGVLRRLVFSRFAAFLPTGQANAAYFASHGVPAKKMVFCPHCVDNERFATHATPAARAAWRDREEIPQDERVILFAGKFEEKKRPIDLLEAFASGPIERSTLVFVGGGELEDLLRKRARELGTRVRFVPFQNQSLMPSVYAAADVLVLPSMGNWETWGLAVNEAMACGVPAIVSSHVGCGPDLVHPGETGWIFPAGDVAALRTWLEEACAADARRREMGQAAQRLVAGAYNYDKASAALFQALQIREKNPDEADPALGAKF